MPFISELSESDLKHILSGYGFRELYSYREFPLGIENANIKVETKKGVFVLREWSTANRANIAFELSLMKELCKKGFPVPKTFKALNGKETIIFKGKRFALFDFMRGKHLKNKKLNPAQLQETGKTLAEMQLALKNLKPKGKSHLKDLFDFGLDHYTIKNTFPKIGKQHQTLLKELEKETKELEPKLRALKKGLRCGPVHHDFIPWNIKFKGNKISATLDFGDACIGAWASDLATTLMDISEINHKIHANKIKQVLKGYQTKIQLNKNEAKALPYLMLHRALQSPFFETNAMIKQPKNKALYAKWLKQDIERAKQIKKQIQKIKEATK